LGRERQRIRLNKIMKRTWTTLFWVGEPSGKENKFIPNTCSYWDDNWQEHFGGIDDPLHRNGFYPAAFTPKQNPFYFALPYGERDDDGRLKQSALDLGPEPLLKNRWIRIIRKVPPLQAFQCYAQWADVGPNGEDDFEWVFGDAEKPRSRFNNHAGLDVSPACWTQLHMTDNGWTEWEFVDEAGVPAGPWKEIVTR
jgi:hypothetical protein